MTQINELIKIIVDLETEHRRLETMFETYTDPTFREVAQMAQLADTIENGLNYLESYYLANEYNGIM